MSKADKIEAEVEGAESGETETTGRRRIPRQEDLPGCEGKRIPKLETLIGKCKENDAEENEVREKGVDLRKKIAEVMHEHKITEYRCRTIEAEAKLKVGKERVSVKLIDADEAEESE